MHPFGLTARYHIRPKWDISGGLLFNAEQQQRDKSRGFSKEYVRLPILINYRLFDRRLSPYVSIGASFSNEIQFANNGGIKTNALIALGV